MAQARAMYTIAVTALSLAVIASFALAGGGLYLLVRRRERKQGLLMLVAALVLFANVLIWTL
jgi:LPXTG-motif cell wall-anchored protein